MRHGLLALATTVVVGVLLVALASPARASGPEAVGRDAERVRLPGTVTRWRPIVARYFDKYAHRVRGRHVRSAEVDYALRIIYRESRGYRLAHNGRFCGLFQVDVRHFRGRDPWPAVSNCATAAMLWARLGWTPWAL